jgi:hypothetical protein
MLSVFTVRSSFVVGSAGSLVSSVDGGGSTWRDQLCISNQSKDPALSEARTHTDRLSCTVQIPALRVFHTYRWMETP